MVLFPVREGAFAVAKCGVFAKKKQLLRCKTVTAVYTAMPPDEDRPGA